MAINYTVSYTFSPSTTISSSQVNTNFSDNANTWNGLEAGTKTIAQIKVDADPTAALQLATKQYVDHYSTWRRPNLVFSSITAVVVESGLDGTSGDIPILFPDGIIRTETSATRTTFNITRNAVLVTSGAQSGLRTSLSEATNTWYALYAVKVTDSTTLWCTVGDTLLPIVGNYASLNSNFGANGWVYLGLIRNGDNSAATGDILQFVQSGNQTQFINAASANGVNINGLRLTTTAGSTGLLYSTTLGTGAANIPNNVPLAYFSCHNGGGGTGALQIGNAQPIYYFMLTENATNRTMVSFWSASVPGVQITGVASTVRDISLAGFVDGVLGVGSNPIL